MCITARPRIHRRNSTTSYNQQYEMRWKSIALILLKLLHVRDALIALRSFVKHAKRLIPKSKLRANKCSQPKIYWIHNWKQTHKDILKVLIKKPIDACDNAVVSQFLNSFNYLLIRLSINLTFDKFHFHRSKRPIRVATTLHLFMLTNERHPSNCKHYVITRPAVYCNPYSILKSLDSSTSSYITAEVSMTQVTFSIFYIYGNPQ